MKFIRLLIIIFSVLAVISLAGYFYIYYQINYPLDKQGQTQEFVIISGQSVQEIAQNLKDQNLIRSTFWFKIYLWLTDQTSQLKAGTYQLNSNQNIPEITAILTLMPVPQASVSITIPEGFSIQQIAERLDKQEAAAKDDFLEEIQAVNRYQQDYDFLQTVPQEADLTGFLFPDTYDFYKNSEQELVVRKILDNFDQKLDEKLRQDIKAQSKTIFEIITMASIIEKEVVSDQDRAIVSGIFWQRFQDNYPLESCATIAYALKLNKWRYSDLDLQVDSTYNTYKNKGLPPGPICNPGLSAIKAAIYPQKSDYYYYLSAPDGQTIFSQTLEEHNANKIKYLK